MGANGSKNTQSMTDTKQDSNRRQRDSEASNPQQKRKILSASLNRRNLEEIPVDIFSMNLNWLNISENCIREIPAEIANLETLSRLACGNNELSFLPEEIGQLKELSWLDCTHNLLREIPDSFSNDFFIFRTLVKVGRSRLE